MAAAAATEAGRVSTGSLHPATPDTLEEACEGYFVDETRGNG
jgi:hypothetical protein